MEQRKVVVIGVSIRKERYANKAVKMLQEASIPVYAYGKRKGEWEGSMVSNEFPRESIHTVSLYLSPKNQQPFYEKIIQLHPRRVIFNPGTENPFFAKMLNERGILTENACTLVLLRTNQFFH